MENLQEEVKKVGLLPVEIKDRHLVLFDINLLPNEYKGENLKDSVEKYENDFGVKIIPYDSSRVNTNGGSGSVIYSGKE